MYIHRELLIKVIIEMLCILTNTTLKNLNKIFQQTYCQIHLNKQCTSTVNVCV